MSLPQYPKYKDSGVAWLGELPAHWSIHPTKRHFRRKKEVNVGMACENRLALTMRGVIPRSIDDLDGLQSSDYEGYQIFERGDLAFKLIDLQNIKTSRVGLVPERGIMSPAYIRLEPQIGVDTRFAYWYFMALYWTQVFNALGGGVRQTLGPEELLNVEFPVPQLSEQAAIAAFLDCETSKIDALIAEQEQLLTLLAEKRQATISRAVTRGLEPGVPMKDSGVTWLGNVPAHWTIKRMKYLVQESVAGPYGSSLTKAMYVDSGYRVYGQQQVIPNDFSVGDYYIPEEKFHEMSRYQVKPNDVLISVMGTIGQAALVPDGVEPGIINPRLVLYRVFEELISPRYLQVFINSSSSQEYFSVAAQGTTMEGLNMVSIGELQVALPPQSEQVEILEFIDIESEKIGTLSAAAAHAIDLLKERRTALIAAAVTGKIDVRDAVPEEMAA